MKVRILGSGYGVCKVKKRFSLDSRHRGGVIIDDRILIDAPSDIFEVASELGFSDMFAKVSEIFISHSHEGHFSLEAIETLAGMRRVRVFASGEVLALIPENDNIETVELFPFMPIEISGYTILPLPANHETEGGEVCLNFLISKEKTLYYGLDGAGINLQVYKLLRGRCVDAFILDCALELKGYTKASMSHGNLLEAARLRDILVDSGICKSDAKFLLSHIPTDRRRSIHDELSEEAKKHGFTVAYDGYFMIC